MGAVPQGVATWIDLHGQIAPEDGEESCELDDPDRRDESTLDPTEPRLRNGGGVGDELLAQAESEPRIADLLPDGADGSNAAAAPAVHRPFSAWHIALSMHEVDCRQIDLGSSADHRATKLVGDGTPAQAGG
jgi:hypothetical protein